MEKAAKVMDFQRLWSLALLQKKKKILSLFQFFSDLSGTRFALYPTAEEI